MRAKQTKTIKMIVDVCMTVLLLCLTAYPATGEVLHEWFGIGMTAALIAHHILNRRWYAALFRGRYNAYRVLTTLISTLLLLSIVPLHLFCHDIFMSYFLPASLAEANNRADALTTKLEQSKKARKKAEEDAAAVEDLRKRLHDAETALSDNISEQTVREAEILSRLQSQSRRFVSKPLNLCCFFGLSNLSLRNL
jgi:hypothetical protein